MTSAEEVNDEIWKPDYRGPDPVSQPVRPPTDGERSPELAEMPDSAGPDSAPRLFEPYPQDDAARTHRRWRPGGVVVGIVAVVAMSTAGAVIVIDSGEDPPDPTSAPANTAADTLGVQSAERFELPDLVALTGEPFVGASPERLPITLDPIWSRSDLAADSDDVWLEVIDRRFVLVAIGRDAELSPASSTLESLDAETGVVRWSADLAVPPNSVDFVATNADSIVLIVDGALTGIDSATGEIVWRFERTPALFEGDVEQLVGTDLLAIGEPDDTSTLVDVTTGDTVGRLDGPRIGTDHVGRWYVRQGSEIVRYDLGNGFRGSTVVATMVDDPVAAVVGSDVLSSAPDGWRTSAATGEARIDEAEWEPIEGTEDFPIAAAILPMLGSTFVVAGAGMVVGAELDEGRMRSAWQRDGVVIAMYPTERGFLVHTASQGGADQTIFDGLDGDAVVSFTLTPGLFDSLVVAGNGVLTKKTSADGSRLAGLDLDGVEMWSIRDVTAASVGDRLIVTTTRLADNSVRFDAVGEPRTP